VPEADAERLHAGMQARFHVRSHLGPGDGEMTATITHVAQAADAASRMVPVVAEVDRQMRDRARPGAFAEVVVPVSGSADSLVVPEIAIRPSEKGFLAFVVDGDVAHERVLSLGMRTEDGKVEVRSGLSAGELLVVRGNEALRDGAPVRAVEGGRGGRSAGAGAGPGAGSSTQALPGRRGS
jgi:RND family efflux transporter MFP subunit